MSTPDYTWLRKQLRDTADLVACGVFSKGKIIRALLDADSALGHVMHVCRYYEVKAEAGETPSFHYLQVLPGDRSESD